MNRILPGHICVSTSIHVFCRQLYCISVCEIQLNDRHLNLGPAACSEGIAVGFLFVWVFSFFVTPLVQIYFSLKSDNQKAMKPMAVNSLTASKGNVNVGKKQIRI